jgi:hypothetical protein
VKKVNLSDKWIITLIILAVIVVIFLFVKLAPFWTSIVALCTFIGGMICGAYLKRFYDKYIKQ